MPAKVIKMSVNLGRDVVATLRGLAEKRGTTMTSVIVGAINMEKYFQGVVDRGGKVLVEDKRGKLRQLVFHTAGAT